MKRESEAAKVEALPESNDYFKAKIGSPYYRFTDVICGLLSNAAIMMFLH